MPVDARRADAEFAVEFDLPVVDPGSAELDVERNVLAVRAHRPVTAGTEEMIAVERPPRGGSSAGD